MDYRRAYWLLFLGIGLLFGVRAALPVLAGEPATLTVWVSAVAAVVIVVSAALALRDPESAGGPDGPSLLFYVAVAAFLLLAAGTILQLRSI